MMLSVEKGGGNFPPGTTPVYGPSRAPIKRWRHRHGYKAAGLLVCYMRELKGPRIREWPSPICPSLGNGVRFALTPHMEAPHVPRVDAGLFNI